MYKNKATKGFKSPFQIKPCQTQPSKLKVSDNEYPVHNLPQNHVRSTDQILGMLLEPSVNCKEEQMKQKLSNQQTQLESDVQNDKAPTTNSKLKTVYNVVFTKVSSKKYKTWEDDGILEVSGKNAVLKNMEGRILGRATVNADILTEGYRFTIGTKDIEIIDEIIQKPGVQNELQNKTHLSPPSKKIKKQIIHPFVPLSSSTKGLKLEYEPLIMPSFKAASLWLEDELTEKECQVLVDPCLATILRSHQRCGVIFLYECIMGIKIANYYGAILADEMGVGKTLQCITLIWTLLRKGPSRQLILKRVMIITPSSLCNNWKKEFTHWLGSHRINPYVVDTKNKPKRFGTYRTDSVLIISYEMFVRYFEDINKITFQLVICDEAHRLKNSDIKAAKLVKQLDCKRRILLTGTPVQNDLQEFYTLVNLVNEGILGTYTEYKHYYEQPIVASQCPSATSDILLLAQSRAEELQKITEKFILRRTQETINKFLPGKHEMVILCRLSNEQEKLYSYVTDCWFNRTVLSDKTSPLTVITALKKICNHPDFFIPEKNSPWKVSIANKKSVTQNYCGKVTVVYTLIRNFKKSKEKLVLVSYYTQALDLFETFCNSENIKHYRLDGSTPNAMRIKIVEEFNLKNDNNEIFLLSGKAGGVGLNLFGASRLILFDSDWNPASDMQAMARIWRDGQQKNCYIYRLLTTGTIEEKIYQRQISKTGLSEAVVYSNTLDSLKFSSAELKDLFYVTTNTTSLTHDSMNCSCDKSTKNVAEVSEYTNPRKHQFTLNDACSKLKLNINQLLQWEHYQQPIPETILEELMLSEVSENITFIFKNSIT